MIEFEAHTAVLRNTKSFRVFGYIYAGTTLFVAVASLLVADTVGRVVLSAAILLAPWLAYRTVTCRLEIRPEGVFLRNPYRSYHIDWGRFGRFSAERWLVWPYVLHVRTKDGKRTHVFVAGSREHGVSRDRVKAQRLVARLQSLAQEVQERGR